MAMVGDVNANKNDRFDIGDSDGSERMIDQSVRWPITC